MRDKAEAPRIGGHRNSDESLANAPTEGLALSKLHAEGCHANLGHKNCGKSPGYLHVGYFGVEDLAICKKHACQVCEPVDVWIEMASR